jgi:hypothetical protein
VTRYYIFLLILILLFFNSSCGSAGPVMKDATQTGEFGATQSAACRQTIQNLYTISFYCPDNLRALQSLFTEAYIQKYNPSLERCSLIEKYEIIELLSQNDADFPQPLNTPGPGVYLYYAEVLITEKPGVSSLGATNPGRVWIRLRIEENGRCKIDGVDGGG